MSDHDAVPGWLHFVAGGLGGTVAAVVTCPLDVVRTRLQASPPPLGKGFAERYLATASSLRSIARKEGFKGLFRGTAAIIMGVGPSRAIYFGTYSWGKSQLCQRYEESTYVHSAAASIAGFATYTFGNPIWLVKTRMQMQTFDTRRGAKGPPTQEAVYRSVTQSIKSIYRTEGLGGFFKGVTASYLGISENMIQFAIYEHLKRTRNQEAHATHSAMDYIVMSSTSKFIASLLTYPHEVLRTRMREQREDLSKTKYPTVLRGFKAIYTQEGMRGLYGGLGAHMIRVIPSTAVLFLVYEYTVKMYARFAGDQESSKP